MKPRTIKERNAMRNYPETTTFHFHNENPAGNIVGDCVIRAISQATGKGWIQTTKELTELSLEKFAPANCEEVYIPYIESHPCISKKQPRKPNNTKYTGSQFCRLLDKLLTNDEKVLAHIGGHHIVCICKVDGRYKVNDIWDSTDGCIGKYWIIP